MKLRGPKSMTKSALAWAQKTHQAQERKAR